MIRSNVVLPSIAGVCFVLRVVLLPAKVGECICSHHSHCGARVDIDMCVVNLSSSADVTCLDCDVAPDVSDAGDA